MANATMPAANQNASEVEWYCASAVVWVFKNILLDSEATKVRTARPVEPATCINKLRTDAPTVVCLALRELMAVDVRGLTNKPNPIPRTAVAVKISGIAVG